MSYCTKAGTEQPLVRFSTELICLANGKDKVMFLTKDDLSSPSAIKIRETEEFDPWEQQGTSSLTSHHEKRICRFRCHAAEWCD